MDLVGVLADPLDGLLDDAELVLVVGAGEVAKNLDAALKKETKLVEVELVGAVDVDHLEDLAELGLVAGLRGDRVDAEDAAEILVGGEGAAELVERHGASLIGVALIEQFPDLGLVLVVPLGSARGGGDHVEFHEGSYGECDEIVRVSIDARATKSQPVGGRAAGCDRSTSVMTSKTPGFFTTVGDCAKSAGQ